MTEIEKQYFDLLVERRKQRAEAIYDPEYRNGFENTIDKYTDQAHCIYELLQNADDTGATYARFFLENGRLLFAHNGIKRFFVSNPDTVIKDKPAGKYGSVNSITAFLSNKPPEENIGKFGIGFMSVFQYTDSPEIYDSNICFRIRDLIVPELITETEALRAPNETLFIFPLGTSKCTKEKAFQDISQKLRSLSHPLMFLNTLKRIDYWIGENHGTYCREEVSIKAVDETSAKRMRFTCDKTEDGEESPQSGDYWFFSRGSRSANRYSVCFALKDENLETFDSYAFCFFPTKTTTGLHFAIHAPFLLTDNREGIKAGESHNEEMIQKLAILAADSLEYLRDIGIENGKNLIDDSLLSIIPTNPSDFSEEDNTNRISFRPFYTAIRDKLYSSQLLPTADGYVTRENAYWAETRQIEDLISQEQLAQLTKNPSAQWVFSKMPRNERQRIDYIRGILGNKIYNNYSLLNGLDESFLKVQSIVWLNHLYQWLLSVQGSSGATNRLKMMPIFRNRLGHNIAAFDNNGQHCLFLNGNDDEKAVCEEHLKDETARKLLQMLGVGEVSPWDDIYNNVIKPCVSKNDGSISSITTFQKFYHYYCDAVKNGNTPKSLIDELAKHPCIMFRTASGQRGNAAPSTLYFPDAELQSWFETKPDTMFVDMDGYSAIEEDAMLRGFMSEMGVQDNVTLRKQVLHSANWKDRMIVSSLGLHYPNSEYSIKWEYPEIDGLEENLSRVSQSADYSKSVLIWNKLIEIIEKQCPYGFEQKLKYKWTAYKTGEMPTPIVSKLRYQKWLKCVNGEFAAPCNISTSTLDAGYDRRADGFYELVHFLLIADDVGEKSNDETLTDAQRADRELLASLKQINNGKLTNDQIVAIIASVLAKSESHNDVISSTQGSYRKDGTANFNGSEASFHEDESDPISRQLRRIGRRIRRKPEETEADLAFESSGANDEESDGYAPPPVDIPNAIKREENNSARRIETLARKQVLWEQVSSTQRHSYGWFRAMLELELLESGGNDSGSRALSIRFGKVEPDPESPRGLLLKWPNRYIPQSVEELDDFTLRLDGHKEIKIESACVKGSMLQVRMRSADEAKGIDFNTVVEAGIDVQSPDFLLRSLVEGFNALAYTNDYDMQHNLCDNIRFVFGPPGTGKTTHLAEKELLPLMQSSEDVRILVLTPTNKAADVLVQRIMHICGGNRSYEDWLIRFGRTFEQEIEDSPVLRDRSFDLRSLRRCVVVTTIDRFPYDGFRGCDKLNEIVWDYVVVDEASMIPLIKIIYPLYCLKPREFIIAGDPLQIQPVVKLAQWQDENIYNMVGLRDFGDPVTKLRNYKVKPLDTQYRSVPAIGELFSRFAYKGKLNHFRGDNSQRSLHLEKLPDITPLNLIEFPVSKYEGIYKAKRLDNSPYHIYSALFAFEFVSFLSRELRAANPRDRFSIGVVSPYRVQANLIGRLLDRNPPPEGISVLADTIHSFQGDECDIMLVVFNPPVLGPRSDPERVFANRETIINVAISRAKDYLFVLVPDLNTEHLDKLPRVKRLRRLMEQSGKCMEYSAQELEELMFGRKDYIEQSTFSTSHQNVNVYGQPEMRYEVRSEDTAIDIQILNDAYSH